MIFWQCLKYIPMLAMIAGLGAVVRYGLYFALALFVLLRIVVGARRKSVPAKLLLPGAILAGLLMVSILGGITNTIRQESWPELLATLRGVFLFGTLLPLLHVVRRPGRWLIFFFTVASVVQIVTVLLSWDLVLNGVAKGEVSYDKQRILGIYDNTWTVVYSSICYCSMCGVMFFYCQKTWQKVACLFLMGLGVMSSLLTISRTALITVPFVILGFGIEYFKNRERKKSDLATQVRTKVVPIVVFGAALLYVCLVKADVFSYYYNLWVNRLFEYNMTEGSRWTTITAGIEIFIKHPLTGIGWDAVAEVAGQYGSLIDASAHNLLVDAAAQGGITGLLFALGVEFLIPIWLLLKSRGVPGFYVYIGAWIALIISNTVVSTLMLESHWDLFCFWIFHILATRERNRLQRDVTSPHDAQSRGIGQLV